MSRPAPPLPLGFAHRGARAECPDNTLPSFRRALALGATALESDAWRTADGVVVLDHDGRFRQGRRRVPVGALPRRALPAHVPSLAELYAECGTGFQLSLDVKDHGAAGAILAVAAEAGAVDRLWLCGSGDELVAWRALSVEVRLVDSTRLSRVPEGLAGRARTLRERGVAAVNLRCNEWDAGRVAAVHAEGLLAFAWDAQRSSAIAALVALGVDGVYSDHVDRMLAGLGRSRAARTSAAERAARCGRTPDRR